MSDGMRDLIPDETHPRADAVRRLLTEAVEPVEPAPGAQARLLARARKQRRRAYERPGRLRWAGGALAATAVVVAGSVYFAGKSGQESNSSAASSPGGTTSAAASRAPEAAPNAGGPTTSGGLRLGTATSPLSPDQQALRDLAARSAAGAPVPKAATQGSTSFDQSMNPDTLTLEGSTLVARLSPGDVQRVALPAVGIGARVLGVALIDSGSGGQVPVVFVRLQARVGYTQDTLVGDVGGRLAVLQLSSKSVLLVRDAGHAYSCAGPLLISQGSSRSYVVAGASLETADTRLAAARPASPGCDFG